MRFLADESCDFVVVRALRAAGHDVEAVAERLGGAEDPAVLDFAVHESRILLTEDKDFGQLFYATSRPSGCVLLIRFPVSARRSLAKTVTNFVDREAERLEGCFVVLQPGRIRIARAPEGDG